MKLSDKDIIPKDWVLTNKRRAPTDRPPPLNWLKTFLRNIVSFYLTHKILNLMKLVYTKDVEWVCNLQISDLWLVFLVHIHKIGSATSLPILQDCLYTINKWEWQEKRRKQPHSEACFFLSFKWSHSFFCVLHLVHIIHFYMAIIWNLKRENFKSK